MACALSPSPFPFPSLPLIRREEKRERDGATWSQIRHGHQGQGGHGAPAAAGSSDSGGAGRCTMMEAAPNPSLRSARAPLPRRHQQGRNLLSVVRDGCMPIWMNAGTLRGGRDGRRGRAATGAAAGWRGELAAAQCGHAGTVSALWRAGEEPKGRRTIWVRSLRWATPTTSGHACPFRYLLPSGRPFEVVRWSWPHNLKLIALVSLPSAAAVATPVIAPASLFPLRRTDAPALFFSVFFCENIRSFLVVQLLAFFADLALSSQ